MDDDAGTGESRKELYQREMEARLNEGTAKLLELHARADAAEARVRVEWYDVLDQVRDKRERLLRKVQGLQRVGEGVWEEMKPGVDNASAAFNDMYQRALSRMK